MRASQVSFRSHEGFQMQVKWTSSDTSVTMLKLAEIPNGGGDSWIAELSFPLDARPKTKMFVPVYFGSCTMS